MVGKVVEKPVTLVVEKVVPPAELPGHQVVLAAPPHEVPGPLQRPQQVRLVRVQHVVHRAVPGRVGIPAGHE